MIRFDSDYIEGAHESILKALNETNFIQTVGYGKDEYCEKARESIKNECKAPNTDVHFLVGGTQTNMTVISSILRPYQGVISATTGHINGHETGAVESLGHKILTVAGQNGKITAKQIDERNKEHLDDKSCEHAVQPGMVYISYPTEIGTVYTKEELEDIYAVCKKNKLYLFIDGARMGYGLMAQGNNVSLEDISNLCDVFYIGGTKVGALLGEAVVIINDELKKDFRYYIKQKGGMLAKGRIIGIQFLTLFEDGLYFKISKHAVEKAMEIKRAFAEKGFSFKCDSTTNQQFPIISNSKLEKLNDKYGYTFWEKHDEEHSVIRFCTSWATTDESVKSLVRDIKNL